MSEVETNNDSETVVSKERFSVRWMALGAAVIMVALLGAENLIWQVVSSDTKQFLQKSVATVTSTKLSDEQKDTLRAETLKRLATPPVIGIAIAVLLAAVMAGFVAGVRSDSLWSGVVASVSGVVVAFIISGAISISAMVAALVFGLLALPGTVLSKKIFS